MSYQSTACTSAINTNTPTTQSQIANQSRADQVPLLITTASVNQELLAAPPEKKPENSEILCAFHLGTYVPKGRFQKNDEKFY